MSVPIEPISDVTTRGIQALIRELGVVNAIRFMNQFRSGSGDYTNDRERLFEGETVSSLIGAIKARKNGA